MSKIKPTDDCTDIVKQIEETYPTRVPVLVFQREKDILPKLEKIKYLPEKSLMLSNFILQIKKQLKIPLDSPMFIFFKGVSLSMSISLGEVYEKYKDDDGMLRAFISGENTLSDQILDTIKNLGTDLGTGIKFIATQPFIYSWDLIVTAKNKIIN